FGRAPIGDGLGASAVGAGVFGSGEEELHRGPGRDDRADVAANENGLAAGGDFTLQPNHLSAHGRDGAVVTDVAFDGGVAEFGGDVFAREQYRSGGAGDDAEVERACEF